MIWARKHPSRKTKLQGQEMMIAELKEHPHHTFGLMMDYGCLPQKPFASPALKAAFGASLSTINEWYAHNATYDTRRETHDARAHVFTKNLRPKCSDASAHHHRDATTSPTSSSHPKHPNQQKNHPVNH